MAISPDRLPSRRPPTLRLTSIDVAWWRIDAQPPDAWRWDGFPSPRNRFDAPGRRVRYAARTERGAFREHFDGSRRTLAGRDAASSVVRLVGRVRVLDLRNEHTLDLLGLDAEIATGRSDRAMRTCWALSERLLDWYDGGLDGLVYTSRTTPQTSVNLAFTAVAPLQPSVVGPIVERQELLDQLVVDDGFRVDLPGWV